MGGINYGQSGQQAQSQSTSQQDSYGYNVTGNQSQAGQSVWGAQQPSLEQLYGQAGALLNGTSSAGQAGQGVADMGSKAWQQQMQPGSNPFFDQSVQASIDQATDAFKRQVLPAIDSRGVGAGQYGSSRDQLARGEAAGEFGQSLGQTAAQQYSTQYAGDQTRALQAVSLTPQMQAAQYAPLSEAASLLGGPTVLGQSQSSGYGIGEQASQARSQATSSSDAKAKNAGLNILSSGSK